MGERIFKIIQRDHENKLKKWIQRQQDLQNSSKSGKKLNINRIALSPDHSWKMMYIIVGKYGISTVDEDTECSIHKKNDFFI